MQCGAASGLHISYNDKGCKRNTHSTFSLSISRCSVAQQVCSQPFPAFCSALFGYDRSVSVFSSVLLFLWMNECMLIFWVNLTVEFGKQDVSPQVRAPETRFPWLSPKEASFSSSRKGWSSFFCFVLFVSVVYFQI